MYWMTCSTQFVHVKPAGSWTFIVCSPASVPVCGKRPSARTGITAGFMIVIESHGSPLAAVTGGSAGKPAIVCAIATRKWPGCPIVSSIFTCSIEPVITVVTAFVFVD